MFHQWWLNIWWFPPYWNHALHCFKFHSVCDKKGVSSSILQAALRYNWIIEFNYDDVKYIWNNSYIWTAVVVKVKNDHRSKFSNLSNWKEEAWQNQGFNGIRTCDLREYRCDDLPTALWSHTLARSIYWVHVFPCSEMMWSLYEIIHICTAVVDESDERSSQ